MIFRDNEGKLVKIERYDYTNDVNYFSQIQNLYIKQKNNNSNNSDQLMNYILSKL